MRYLSHIGGGEFSDWRTLKKNQSQTFSKPYNWVQCPVRMGDVEISRQHFCWERYKDAFRLTADTDQSFFLVL